MTTQIDAYECGYRLAIAIYKIAKREAAGELGHHEELSEARRWEIQLEAYAFCQEWRDFFAGRLLRPNDVDPLPEPVPATPKNRQGGRKPAGQMKILDKASNFLRDHGPATANEVAQAAGCARDNACKMLRSHPDRFRMVGRFKEGTRHARLWDIKR